MLTELHGAHRRTFDAIFQHPISRNLTWREVRSMLDAMSDVLQHEHGQTLKLSRNGRTVVLHPPLQKNVSDVQELMHLRRFLEGSSSLPVPQPRAPGVHLLVVIDHRLARVYKAELHGSVPERILPYDQSGSGRHLHHVENDSNGQRKPERSSFYEAIAKTLQGAEQILLFGSGTGASSAMDQLLAELKQHHKELADLVVASVVVDQPHLTEDQLLAKARKFYAERESSEEATN
jgi:hypothetical protein